MATSPSAAARDDTPLFAEPLDWTPLREMLTATRARSVALIDGLRPEDMTVQSMPDASPTDPGAARELMARFRHECGARYLLIGFDTPPGAGKSLERLVLAYDDPEGITTRFHRNVLVRLRDELGADVDPDAFRHVARYDETLSRIEMHLESERRQTIVVDGERFVLEAGERLHTESSRKHAPHAFARLAGEAGWTESARWSDTDGWFAIALFEA